MSALLLADISQVFDHAWPYIFGPLGALTDEDRELLRRLAVAIVLRRMGAPAMLFLQSLRPLNYIGSQALVFLRPFLTPLFNPRDYKRLAEIAERRQGIGALINRCTGPGMF